MNYPDLLGPSEQAAVRAENVSRAQAIYGNQGLHPAARGFAFIGERAVQYLETAPVLVMGAIPTTGAVRRANVLFIRHKMEPLCLAGAPLKVVLRAFGISPALRKLSASAISPKYGPTIFALSKLDPDLLGRIVPEKAGAQRKWLGALTAWRGNMGIRRRPADTEFRWAAERTAQAGVDKHAVGTVVDFICSGEPFNTAWRWPRALEESMRWHTRIRVDQQLVGTPFKHDTVIDFGSHPDTGEVAEFTFVALRTPAALAEEGAAMHHCVASYITDVIRGDCHIVGIRKDGKRIATLELGDGRLRQLKGPLNAVVDHAATTAAAYFAQQYAPKPPLKHRGRK